MGGQRASTMGLGDDSGSQQGQDGGGSRGINYSAPHMRYVLLYVSSNSSLICMCYQQALTGSGFSVSGRVG